MNQTTNSPTIKCDGISYQVYEGDFIRTLEEIKGFSLYHSQKNQHLFPHNKPPLVSTSELRSFKQLPNVTLRESKVLEGQREYIFTNTVHEKVKKPNPFKGEKIQSVTREELLDTLTDEGNIIIDTQISQADKARALYTLGYTNITELAKILGAYYSAVQSACKNLIKKEV